MLLLSAVIISAAGVVCLFPVQSNVNDYYISQSTPVQLVCLVNVIIGLHL